ncbi:hypothetical protein GJ496_009591 [Pomphorhynchus laevis]|nr:hypothetical protein GJ496_009591 [Pomphorhynchus laevis]
MALEDKRIYDSTVNGRRVCRLDQIPINGKSPQCTCRAVMFLGYKFDGLTNKYDTSGAHSDLCRRSLRRSNKPNAACNRAHDMTSVRRAICSC